MKKAEGLKVKTKVRSGGGWFPKYSTHAESLKNAVYSRRRFSFPDWRRTNCPINQNPLSPFREPIPKCGDVQVS